LLDAYCIREDLDADSRQQINEQIAMKLEKMLVSIIY